MRASASTILMLRAGANRVMANTIAAAIDPVRLTVTPNLLARTRTTAMKARGNKPRRFEREHNTDARSARIALRTVPNATFSGFCILWNTNTSFTTNKMTQIESVSGKIERCCEFPAGQRLSILLVPPHYVR
jgi:hypothetical protein